MEVRSLGNIYKDNWGTGLPGNVWDKDQLCPTLTTMQGGGRQPMIIANINPSGNGINGAVHTVDAEAPTITTNKGEGSKIIVAMRGRNPDNPSDRTVGSPTEQRLEPNSQGICNTLTSVQKDNLVMERGVDYEKGFSVEILQILRKEIGEEDFSEWAIRGVWCVLQEEVLRQNVYAKGIYENWTHRPELFKFAYNSKGNQYSIHSEKAMRDMWKNWKDGCTPHRRGLSEQQCREFDDFMSQLPYETTQRKKFVYCLWETNKGIGLLRETLSEIQKIWESTPSETVQRCTYRIRKLTPRCCWRLMDFKDEDFEKAAQVNSNTQLYKQAGNSIVKNVLVAILGQMIPGKEEVYKNI